MTLEDVKEAVRSLYVLKANESLTRRMIEVCRMTTEFKETLDPLSPEYKVVNALQHQIASDILGVDLERLR
jgi:hypothetical protein